MPKSSLGECKDLDNLRCALTRESTRTAREAATGSRFNALCRDEKALVSCMSRELVQYDHYLHVLKEAAFLNRFITMVQTFAQRKTRELYLKLSGIVGAAYMSCLETFLYELRPVVSLHEQLQGYLITQAYRSWAVGTKRNPTHKYKAYFRYQFPACDFNHPLVLHNPDLWVDNSVKIFYTLVDVFTKFMNTRAYALSSTTLLWLGKLIRSCNGTAYGNASEYVAGSCLRICRCSNAPVTAEQCPEFNAVWFPQFCMYVQFICAQTLCKGVLVIDWQKTCNCQDDARQRALITRCFSYGIVEYELYYRPTFF